MIRWMTPTSGIPAFFRPRQAETEEEDVELAEDSPRPSENIQGKCSTFVSNRWN